MEAHGKTACKLVYLAKLRELFPLHLPFRANAIGWAFVAKSIGSKFDKALHEDSEVHSSRRQVLWWRQAIDVPLHREAQDLNASKAPMKVKAMKASFALN